MIPFKFRLKLIFILFFIDFGTNNAQSSNDSTSDESKLNLSTSVRNRRSNFPCGQSFVPCDNFEGNDNHVEDSNEKSADTAEIAKLKKLLDKEGLQFMAVRAKAEIDRLYNETEAAAFDDFRSTDFLFSTLAWNELMSTDRYAKDMSYSALISLAATERTKEKGMNTSEIGKILPVMPINDTVIKKICPLNVIAECIPGKYRSFSGHCNNVDAPLKGATYEPMQRLLPADYEDGISQPRLAKSRNSLSSARHIAKSVFGNTQIYDKHCSLILSQWAQFIYADMVHIGSTRLFKGNQSIPLPCCAFEHPECLPILTDEDDQTYKARGQCIPYSRSFTSSREECSLGPREQANIQTSFLDASHLYGSSVQEANQLRLFKNGQLKSLQQSRRRELPPPQTTPSPACASKSAINTCFMTGSAWINLLPTNAAFHTIWLRQHNTIAKKLQQLNMHWDDERLYQETRRIVIAQIQHITYNEFLPILLGKEQSAKQGLQLRKRSFDSGYKMKMNPSVLNEFASSVGLFFFSLLPDTITQVSEHGIYTGTKQLSTVFNDPSILYLGDKVESILRNMIQAPILRPGLQMSEEFRERFLRGSEQYGLDFAALIIQMGRDHGLPTYIS